MLTKREGLLFAACVLLAGFVASWADRRRLWRRTRALPGWSRSRSPSPGESGSRCTGSRATGRSTGYLGALPIPRAGLAFVRACRDDAVRPGSVAFRFPCSPRRHRPRSPRAVPGGSPSMPECSWSPAVAGCYLGDLVDTCARLTSGRRRIPIVRMTGTTDPRAGSTHAARPPTGVVRDESERSSSVPRSTAVARCLHHALDRGLGDRPDRRAFASGSDARRLLRQRAARRCTAVSNRGRLRLASDSR